MIRPTANLTQKVCASNNLVQRPCTDGGEHFAHFGCVEGDQVHNLVSIASELFTQRLVLCTHANRAGIGLALAHHDAPHRDQRGCPDAVFLGTQHRRHDDVTARAQATVGPQGHTVAQLVHRKHLMCFRQAHLPRQTGVFDRGRRRRTCATVVT